jgi:hypothetical protein
MTILIIVGTVILLAVVFAIMQYKKTGSLELKTFLHGFGVDLSEGFEAVWISFRTIILFALQGLFAHLEAETLEQLMPYREDSYLMGLGFALVAMICGMTAAIEIRLQSDRRTIIRPAINELKVQDWYKDQMIKNFDKKYKTGKWIIGANAIIALGMHATIVLIALFSLWQHEEYVSLIASGMIEPVEGVPALNYTGYFGTPLVVSSVFIGSLGFFVEFLLGLVSNVREELYKYKPHMEIIETSSDLEEEYGEYEYEDDDEYYEDDDKDDKDDKNNKDTKEDMNNSELVNIQTFFQDTLTLADVSSQELDKVEFSYTGGEGFEELITDLIGIYSKSMFAKKVGQHDTLKKFKDNYTSCKSEESKKQAEAAMQTQYRTLLNKFTILTQFVTEVESKLKKADKLANSKNVDKLKELKKDTEPLIKKLTNSKDVLEKQYESLLKVVNFIEI